MNPQDFEKTVKFKEKAYQPFGEETYKKATSSAASNTVSNAAEEAPPKENAKPAIKKLTKEETAYLVSGGVLLALAAGVVAVAYMDTPPEPDIEDPQPVTPFPEPVKPEPEQPGPGKPEPVKPEPIVVTVPDEIKIAEGVSDDQSFKQAFDTARHELGPGHVFEWRGTVFNTYTGSELENMSPKQHEEWLGHYQEIIDDIDPYPVIPDDEPVVPPVTDGHLTINTVDGHFVWTGIDKNEDGIAEVLIAKEEGHPPVIFVDTDNDGKTDTRFDYDAETGQLMATEITPTAYSMSEVSDLPAIAEEGLQAPEEAVVYEGDYQVDIQSQGDNYIINMASAEAEFADVRAAFFDDTPPAFGLDNDGDGKIETVYTYEGGHTSSIPIETPVEIPIIKAEEGEEPIVIPGPEDEDDPVDDDPQEETEEEENSANNFNNNDDAADDFYYQA